MLVLSIIIGLYLVAIIFFGIVALLTVYKHLEKLTTLRMVLFFTVLPLLQVRTFLEIQNEK